MPQADVNGVGIPPRVGVVLFDLDGTLIDSAPDLAGTGNDMRLARGLEALPIAQLRPMVGAGARGMLAAALGVSPRMPTFRHCATSSCSATKPA